MKEDGFSQNSNFSDEPTIHTSGKVNRPNVQKWGIEKPHANVLHKRDSSKLNVFCAISNCKKVYVPFFFEQNTVTGTAYLGMLQQ